MWFQIFFSFVCLLAMVVLTAFIINGNKEHDGKAAPGWWVVSILIDQLFFVAILAVWWKEWWGTHLWLMYVSTGIAIAGITLGAIAKIYTKRHW